MDTRMAGSIWDAESIKRMRQARASEKVSSPAFEYVEGRGFVPSEDAQKVVEYLRGRSGRSLVAQPANAVQALDGVPMWGSGAGFANIGSGVATVDPIRGSTFTLAHEGGHALSPSALRESMARREASKEIDPIHVPRDSGARLRYVHEMLAKPTMVEEARAQGIARGVIEALALPEDSLDWKEDPSLANKDLSYPASYMERGAGLYRKTEIGPPSPGERREMDAIYRAVPEALRREYESGRSWAKGP